MPSLSPGKKHTLKSFVVKSKHKSRKKKLATYRGSLDSKSYRDVQKIAKSNNVRANTKRSVMTNALVRKKHKSMVNPSPTSSTSPKTNKTRKSSSKRSASPVATAVPSKSCTRPMNSIYIVDAKDGTMQPTSNISKNMTITHEFFMPNFNRSLSHSEINNLIKHKPGITLHKIETGNPPYRDRMKFLDMNFLSQYMASCNFLFRGFSVGSAEYISATDTFKNTLRRLKINIPVFEDAYNEEFRRIAGEHPEYTLEDKIYNKLDDFKNVNLFNLKNKSGTAITSALKHGIYKDVRNLYSQASRYYSRKDITQDTIDDFEKIEHYIQLINEPTPYLNDVRSHHNKIKNILRKMFQTEPNSKLKAYINKYSIEKTKLDDREVHQFNISLNDIYKILVKNTPGLRLPPHVIDSSEFIFQYANIDEYYKAKNITPQKHMNVMEQALLIYGMIDSNAEVKKEYNTYISDNDRFDNLSYDDIAKYKNVKQLITKVKALKTVFTNRVIHSNGDMDAVVEDLANGIEDVKNQLSILGCSEKKNMAKKNRRTQILDMVRNMTRKERAYSKRRNK